MSINRVNPLGGDTTESYNTGYNAGYNAGYSVGYAAGAATALTSLEFIDKMACVTTSSTHNPDGEVGPGSDQTITPTANPFGPFAVESTTVRCVGFQVYDDNFVGTGTYKVKRTDQVLSGYSAIDSGAYGAAGVAGNNRDMDDDIEYVIINGGNGFGNITVTFFYTVVRDE